MKRYRYLYRIAMAALVAFGVAVSGEASAGARALISLHDNGDMNWSQRVALQDSLRERFGFTETRFLVDAMPDEIPSHVKQFLEEGADENDRRLVWVSGLSRDHGPAASICPAPGFAPIRPTAPSLILAPACYGDVLLMPQGARHFGITEPSVSRETSRVGRIRAGDAPWLAHLALPADGARFVTGADGMIQRFLGRPDGDTLDAAALLHLLRSEFRWNGSSYTATLDLFDRGIERDELLPFALGAHSRPVLRGRTLAIHKRELALYARPAPKAGAALHLRAGERIRVLRQGRDKTLRYVAAPGGIFGWVRTDDLVD